MNLATLFKDFRLEKVKLNLKIAEAEFSPPACRTMMRLGSCMSKC